MATTQIPTSGASTELPWSVRFPNIPDAGTRHFATQQEAEAYGRRAGFTYAVERAVPTTAQLLSLLDRSDRAVEEAVLRIYAGQTPDEQDQHVTVEENGLGFNAYDADLLSSFAEQIRAVNSRPGFRLSVRQMAVARRRIRKYVGQLHALAEMKARRQAVMVTL